MTIAIITTTTGRITAHSTITVNGETTPILALASVGGIFAPRRIVETLAELGWRPATNYYDDLRPSPDEDVMEMDIRPATHDTEEN